MFEGPLPGKHHRSPSFVAGLDHVPVVHGTAGLHYGLNTFADTHHDAVPEREERIAHHGGAGQAAFFFRHPGVNGLLLLFVFKLVVGHAELFEGEAPVWDTLGRLKAYLEGFFDGEWPLRGRVGLVERPGAVG